MGIQESGVQHIPSNHNYAVTHNSVKKAVNLLVMTPRQQCYDRRDLQREQIQVMCHRQQSKNII